MLRLLAKILRLYLKNKATPPSLLQQQNQCYPANCFAHTEFPPSWVILGAYTFTPLAMPSLLSKNGVFLLLCDLPLLFLGNKCPVLALMGSLAHL